jgi:CHAT domain-containing protein/tetratricopeptide (TPR) repeat protein
VAPERDDPALREALDAIELACLLDRISLDLLAQARALDLNPGPFAARSRFLLANVLYRLDHDNEALEGFRQAEAMAIQHGDARTRALAVMRQVEWAVFHKQWAEAERRWEESLALCDPLGEPYQRARPRLARGQILQAARRWEEAAASFEEAAPLYELAAHPKQAEKCLHLAHQARLRAAAVAGRIPDEATPAERRRLARWLMDEIFEQDTSPEKALALASSALAIPELPDDDRWLLLAVSAGWWLALGDLPRARAAIESARRYQPQEDQELPLLDLQDAAITLNEGGSLSPAQEALILEDPRALSWEEPSTRLNRAILWLRRGAVERAISELEEAEKAIDNLPREEALSYRALRLQSVLQRVHCLLLLNRWIPAMELLREVEPLAEQGSVLEQAFFWFRVAHVLWITGQFDEAQQGFLDVLKICQDLPSRLPLQGLALAFAARVAVHLKPEEHLADYTVWISSWLDDGGCSDLILAVLLHARGLLTASVEDLCLASERCLAAGLPWDAADMLDDAALLCLERDDMARALLLSRRAASLLDEALAVAPDDESRVGFSARSRFLRARLVRLLWESDPEEAFAEVVWSKGAALLALLSLRWNARPERPVLPCSYRHADSSPERWLAQVGDPLALRVAPPPAIDLEAVRRLYRELTSTDAAAIKLDREHAVSAPAILAAIPQDAALVEWFTSDGEIFVFFARSGLLRSFHRRLPPSFAECAESVRLIARQTGPLSRTNRRVFLAALRLLHEVLIAPWLDLAAGISRLFLCPDGQLAGLPFAALGLPGAPALLDRFELALLLSSSQLVTAPPPERGPPGVFALVRGEDGARPLPWATAELEAISALGARHGWSVRSVGAGASLADVEQALRGASAWHFAGHAGFVEEQGMAAYLATPERAWTAAELLGLDLRGLRLVVLSACETGRASEDRGDERVGLLRALHAAGAETLVCSSWPAADASTARMASLFYERWFRGERASSALRHAQLQLRGEVENDPGGFPWAWANFAVYGPG